MGPDHTMLTMVSMSTADIDHGVLFNSTKKRKLSKFGFVPSQSDSIINGWNDNDDERQISVCTDESVRNDKKRERAVSRKVSPPRASEEDIKLTPMVEAPAEENHETDPAPTDATTGESDTCDDKNSLSRDSSSDESDTDEEEIMMWAHKMFGCPLRPPPSKQEKQQLRGPVKPSIPIHIHIPPPVHMTTPQFLSKADPEARARRKRAKKERMKERMKASESFDDCSFLESHKRSTPGDESTKASELEMSHEVNNTDIIESDVGPIARKKKRKKGKKKREVDRLYEVNDSDGFGSSKLPVAQARGATKVSEIDFAHEEYDNGIIEQHNHHISRKRKKQIVLPPIKEAEKLNVKSDQLNMEEDRRKRELAKPLTPKQIREILKEDAFEAPVDTNSWVRRSVRRPCSALLNSKPVKSLVKKLKKNHKEMVVLKMKKFVNDPDAPQIVLDKVLDALEENSNCEALYIQNFNEGMRDCQVLHLLRILQQPSCNIWCLNIGETYNVDTETWEKFTKGLRFTKVTHMYASEHTITTEMKDVIRATIRENRSKHDMHINPNNLDVIVQCTHCWWNPVNAKCLRPYLRKNGYEQFLNDKEAQGLKGSTSAAPSM